MKNLMDVLKERDLDLKLTFGGTRPPALTHAQAAERAVEYVLEQRSDYATQEEFDAQFDRHGVFDEALGPFGLYLLGEAGEVVAHTEVTLPSFKLVDDVAKLLLSAELLVGGLSVTKIQVQCAGGELLPVEFIQQFDDPPDAKIEA